MRKLYLGVGATLGAIAGITLAVLELRANLVDHSPTTPPQQSVRKVQGTIEREDTFEPVSGFGLIYRIETQTSEGRRPYFFVGEEQEIRALDRNFNIGDRVLIEERATIMSLDGEQGLLPDWMRHYQQ